MRSNALLVSAFAASSLACFLESSPAEVDFFIRRRLAEPADEPLYTLEFSDGTTRQVTEADKWDIKRVSCCE
jgi:bacterial leucyl aminopeptidase